MLHQDIKSPGPLGLKNQARLHFFESNVSKRWSVQISQGAAN